MRTQRDLGSGIPACETSYLGIVPTTVFSPMIKKAAPPVSWIRIIGSVSTLAVVLATGVAAQQSDYYIDSTFVGSWTPYLTKDTALSPVLTLRSDGKSIMRLTQVHQSFSGDTHQRIVLTGTWRVRKGRMKQLCVAPSDGENVSCQIAFKNGPDLLVLETDQVPWKRVEPEVVVQPPSHVGPAPAMKSLPFGLTHSQDSALATLDPVRLPSFSSSKGASASSRSAMPPSPPDTQTYYGDQVEKPAIPYEDNPKPLYPSKLERKGVDGEVLVQFVIDTTGRVDMSTTRVLRSTDSLFAQSVINVLPHMKFYPAQLNGHKVKYAAEFPFSFVKPR